MRIANTNQDFDLDTLEAATQLDGDTTEQALELALLIAERSHNIRQR